MPAAHAAPAQFRVMAIARALAAALGAVRVARQAACHLPKNAAMSSVPLLVRPLEAHAAQVHLAALRSRPAFP